MIVLCIFYTVPLYWAVNTDVRGLIKATSAPKNPIAILSDARAGSIFTSKAISGKFMVFATNKPSTVRAVL